MKAKQIGQAIAFATGTFATVMLFIFQPPNPSYVAADALDQLLAEDKIAAAYYDTEDGQVYLHLREADGGQARPAPLRYRPASVNAAVGRLSATPAHRAGRLAIAPYEPIPLWGKFAAIMALSLVLMIAMKVRGRLQRRKRKKNAPFKVVTNPKTRFRDVAGLDNVKEELREITSFITDRSAYRNLGAKLPKGVLLSGAPGTGKTLLARAIAGEAGVSFISLSGSDFVEMFVGVGSSRVRDLFKTAKEHAPCIVFIDEIDAVGRARLGGAGGFGGGQERENTLNSLLVEMDGFNGSENIVIIAATNRPEILDEALTRPGRFDRTVYLNKPDVDSRRRIFELHLKSYRRNPAGLAVDRLASLTAGATGADIANICNDAAFLAGRRGLPAVDMETLKDAIDRQLSGIYNNDILRGKDRRIAAVHECGHALATYYLPDSPPLLKVSLLPRNNQGYAHTQYGKDQNTLLTAEMLRNRMTIALAGRAAEELVFGRVTNAGATDLAKARQIAERIVREFGVRTGGDAGAGILKVQPPRNATDTPYLSESYLAAFETEIDRLVTAAQGAARDLLRDREEDLRACADLLHERETVTFGEFGALLERSAPRDRAPVMG